MKMRSSFVVLAAVLVLAFAASSEAVRTKRVHSKQSLDLLDANPSLLFERFERDQGKSYGTVEERARRFDIFRSNVEKARALNARSGSSATFGVTKFMDWTEQEFSEKVLMRKQHGAQVPRREGGFKLRGAIEDAPSSWDWRDHGAVTSVKNQGGVGTCWAFSAVGSIEGQHAIKTGNLVSLSVEQISDCDNTAFPQNNSADCGPNGGLPFMAFEYVMNAGGLELESAYPYCIGDWSCNPCFPKGYDEHICGHRLPADKCDPKDSCDAKFDPSKIAVKIDTWASIAPDKNETRMAAELVQSGPVSIGIDAESLQMYWFGIIVSRMCSSDPRAADHAVLLTGFGTAKDMFFQEMKYWEVKNSWGGSWGEKGYFRARFGTNTCGIANHGATAVIH